MIAAPSQDRFFLTANRRKECPQGVSKSWTMNTFEIPHSRVLAVFLAICANFAIYA
jgi:hypothetical protein